MLLSISRCCEWRWLSRLRLLIAIACTSLSID